MKRSPPHLSGWASFAAHPLRECYSRNGRREALQSPRVEASTFDGREIVGKSVVSRLLCAYIRRMLP